MHPRPSMSGFVDPVSLCVSRLTGVGAKVSQPAECDQRTRDASLRNEAMAWMRVLDSFSLFSRRIHTISRCSITVSCVNFMLLLYPQVRSSWIWWVYRTVVVEVWYHSVHMTSHDNGVCDISGWTCLFDHDQCGAQALHHVGKNECHVPDGMKWALELVASCCFAVLIHFGICWFFTLTNHLFENQT